MIQMISVSYVLITSPVRVSIHGKVWLYVDAEVDVLSEATDILWQLSRRCVE